MTRSSIAGIRHSKQWPLWCDEVYQALQSEALCEGIQRCDTLTQKNREVGNSFCIFH